VRDPLSGRRIDELWSKSPAHASAFEIVRLDDQPARC
jgi:hypothetical protein